MKRIKTPIRNRLKTTTLDHLIRIAMTGPPLSDWDAVPALRKWEAMRKRKIMKHQRCRCLGGITMSHTQQQTAAVIPFCTAIAMQYNSYAIRSQSVLTTTSTGRVYKVQFECRARHSTYTSEIASIACLHNFFRNTLLSCDLSASRQSTVDSFVYGEL